MGLVSKDGYLIDEETGEVIGHAEAEGFRVTDQASAEWVLGKMAEEDGEVLALTARRNAMVANFSAMIREHESRLAWLNNRFRHELEAFAEAELHGKKTRTHKTAFGKLSFRETPGSIVVIDRAAALAWAESSAPEAVKVEKSVLVSQLKGRNDLPAAFEVLPPATKFSIDTGVKGEKA